MRNILLNPGPVTLSDGVRAAAVREDLCHREPEFFEAQARVLAGLVGVYDADPAVWRAVSLGGSGTAALEAMMASLLPADARLLVLENGVYGERMSRVAAVHRIDYEALTHPWGGALELDAIAARLDKGAFTHLAMVHHETTTGRLNPLGELLDLCQRHGVAVLLDGVSSFGAEAIPFDHPALEAVAATANKCLHGIPGLAFVMCRAGVLERDTPRRSLYLHLPDWAAKQQADSTPYTPPVNSVLALEQALRELAREGGWRGRRKSYRQRAGRVCDDLGALGVQPWLAPEDSSCVLRSYRLPRGFAYDTVHDALKEAGFVIYEGQGNLATEMFRVSTMGDIDAADLERLGAAFNQLFSPPARAAHRS